MSSVRATVSLALAAVVCLWASAPLSARESNGTPEAKAFFAEGEAAVKARKQAEAAAAFRKAIDADPDFVDAHQRFIEVSQRLESSSETPPATTVQALYEEWARRYPTRAIYQWALGFLRPEPEKADAFFTKALALDPAFARAHAQLARNADLRGDFAAQRQHLRLAVDSNPDDPRYLLQYGYAHKRSDRARFHDIARQVIDRFPASQAASQALWYLAADTPNPERRAIYERLRANYPVDRYSYSLAALFNWYGELTTPSEALPLAKEVAAAIPTNKGWQTRVAVQEAFVRAQSLIASGRFTDALEQLEKVSRPSGGHGTTWTLLRAEASAGAGQVDRAYASLIDSAATTPDTRLDAPLLKYAAAIGKAARDIDADVWRVRDARAAPAATFELPATRDGAPVKLADYRGRPVLLAFWFPGCHGCREEFPYLQQVHEKFEGRGLAVLAINVEPPQRASVLPLLAATGITFASVESDWTWAEKQYGVTGTPEAVLIDQQGRIMFRPEVYDADSRLGLERQVEALLNRAQP